ncbi:ABC transporter permease [Asanoa sp. NPDC050611]|uniref:ABC transporter permease n=1 Tax=Asanoa sp. NPDC050611 TaxID=3157098 RepID=UPI00340D4C9B
MSDFVEEETRPVPVVRRFLRDRGALASVVVLLLLLVGSLLASWLVPDKATQTSGSLHRPPSAGHLLGTDELGRDLAARLLIGAQASVVVAFASALLGMAIGVAAGLVGGYVGRWWDSVLMRVMDLLLALPMVLVALVVVVVLGPSTLNVVIAIAVAAVPTFARLARAGVLELRDRQFVLAAKAMGAGSVDIMTRTVLPNIMGPIIVQFVVVAASAVVAAASLSFLGLGVPPPAPSWGSMLQQSQSYLFDNAWYGVFPGLALALTVLCLDRIGVGLQRVLGSSGAADIAVEVR